MRAAPHTGRLSEAAEQVASAVQQKTTITPCEAG